MPQDPQEHFAGNSAINAEIHNILSSFPEPSRSRMRKKIRQAKATLDRLGTDQADESARHTFREFLIARQFNSAGFCLEYDKSVNAQTPDWYDEKNRIVLEVFTCERGGSSSPVKRVATRLAEKATKYRTLVRTKSLHFVIAVHGDFAIAFDADDCKEAIAYDRLFERYPEVSGVILFGETNVVQVKRTDGSMARKQLYGYSYFANKNATRKIDLSMILRGDEAIPSL